VSKIRVTLKVAQHASAVLPDQLQEWDSVPVRTIPPSKVSSSMASASDAEGFSKAIFMSIAFRNVLQGM